MKSVIMLRHSRLITEGAYDTKLIGCYSSLKNVKEVIKRYKKIEGFKDYPNDFNIETIEADINDFNNMCGEFNDNVVFRLVHEYYDGVEFDYVTELGIYSTIGKANEAQKKYSEQEILKDYPDGFCIDEIKVDFDYWSSGFVKYEDN